MKKFILLITIPVLAIAVAAGVLIYSLNGRSGNATLAEPAMNKNIAASSIKTAISPPKLAISEPIADALKLGNEKTVRNLCDAGFFAGFPERFTGYPPALILRQRPPKRISTYRFTPSARANCCP